MLITADPEHPLRIAEVREVFTGVFIVDTDILTTEEHAQLARSVNKVLGRLIGPGEVTTDGLRASSEEELLDKAVDALEAALLSWGFVNDDTAYQVGQSAVLMLSRGATPHSDVHNREWQNSLFWTYVLQAQDEDLVFPNLGLRSGQLIVFDPGQPHAVLPRGADCFFKKDFPSSRRQAFLAGDFEFLPKHMKTLGMASSSAQMFSRLLVDIRKASVSERTGRVTP